MALTLWTGADGATLAFESPHHARVWDALNPGTLALVDVTGAPIVPAADLAQAAETGTAFVLPEPALPVEQPAVPLPPEAESGRRFALVRLSEGGEDVYHAFGEEAQALAFVAAYKQATGDDVEHDLYVDVGQDSIDQLDTVELHVDA